MQQEQQQERGHHNVDDALSEIFLAPRSVDKQEQQQQYIPTTERSRSDLILLDEENAKLNNDEEQTRRTSNTKRHNNDNNSNRHKSTDTASFARQQQFESDYYSPHGPRQQSIRSVSTLSSHQTTGNISDGRTFSTEKRLSLSRERIQEIIARQESFNDENSEKELSKRKTTRKSASFVHDGDRKPSPKVSKPQLRPTYKTSSSRRHIQENLIRQERHDDRLEQKIRRNDDETRERNNKKLPPPQEEEKEEQQQRSDNDVKRAARQEKRRQVLPIGNPLLRPWFFRRNNNNKNNANKKMHSNKNEIITPPSPARQIIHKRQNKHAPKQRKHEQQQHNDDDVGIFYNDASSSSPQEYTPDHVVTPVAPGAVAVQDGRESMRTKALMPGNSQRILPELRIIPPQQEPEDEWSREHMLAISNDDNNKDNKDNDDKKRRLSHVLCGLVLVVIVAIGCGVGLTVGRGGGDTNSTTTTAPPTIFVPSPAPSLTPTLDMNVLLFEFLLNASSTLLFLDDVDMALNNASSAQYRAALWLSNDPNLTTTTSLSTTSFFMDNQDRILQRYTMATLYFSLGGPQWVQRRDWLSYTVHECEWQQNVAMNMNLAPCRDDEENATTTRVIQSLAFSNNNLRGNIPPELGFLSSSLEMFSLMNDNQVTGTIPSQIGLLSVLRGIELFQLELSGTLSPQLFDNKKDLLVLDLGANQFRGPILTEIGQLTNLVRLQIAANRFDSTIPTELGNLTNLEFLIASSNSFSGTIPSEIGLLSKLEFLEMATLGTVNGPLPTEIWTVSSNLQFLSLAGNLAPGSIPSDIATLTALSHLELSINRLSGSIVSEMGVLQNLKYLNLEANRLSGTVPTELGLLSQLTFLSLGENPFIRGTLPSQISALQTMGQLKQLIPF